MTKDASKTTTQANNRSLTDISASQNVHLGRLLAAVLVNLRQQGGLLGHAEPGPRSESVVGIQQSPREAVVRLPGVGATRVAVEYSGGS